MKKVKNPDLSIIIPVYNEVRYIGEVISRIKKLPIDKEIIVVDDYSTDGTRNFLLDCDNIRTVFHKYNRGKGAAVRSGTATARGKWIIIQDADLENNPGDIIRILNYIKKKDRIVVYGSRFLGGGQFPFKYLLANRILTAITNILYGIHISDMETCYKCVKRVVLMDLNLKARGFEIEPEITAKLARYGYKIFEIPINYTPRGVEEGKKIGWKDGLKAVFTLFHYWWV